MPTLEDAYAACRALNRRHGTTYYWATAVLPSVKRHHVHALYGFCRYADEVVDDLGPAQVEERTAALKQFGTQFFEDLETGRSEHPVLHATIHTVRAFDLHPDLFERFLASMAMDLHVTGYRTYEDLCRYMDGSAAVIGEMMLPILEPVSPAALAPARDLGLAFQLTNFLRDVAEDLDRGRIYLPQEDIDRFGADPARRVVDDAWIALARFEIARCRELYRSADEGIAMLPPRTGEPIRAARRLYAGILDRIEAAGYDVFSQRARVPLAHKLAVVARLGVRARTGSGGPATRRHRGRS